MLILSYCQTQNVLFWLFEEFLLESDSYAYKSQSMSEDLLVGICHSGTLSLTSLEAIIRVVIATSSLGCGINCKDLCNDFHFGPSHSLVEYCQQIGRVGRSGEKLCHAVLYSYPQAASTVSSEMKSYIESTDRVCLRGKLFSPFNEHSNLFPPIVPGHTCCSFCSQKCNCAGPSCISSYPFETLDDEPSENQQKSPSSLIFVRNVSDSDKDAVRQALVNFHKDCLSSSTQSVPSGIISGLTQRIIEEIINMLTFISSPAYLIENLSFHMEDSLADSIFSLITRYFNEPVTQSTQNQCLISEEDKYVFSDSSVEEDDEIDEDIL